MNTSFEAALKAARLQILSYAPNKTRPVKLAKGNAIEVSKFADLLRDQLGAEAPDHPEVFRATLDTSKLTAMLEAYAQAHDSIKPDKKGDDDKIEIPEEYAHLTLNVDPTSSGKDIKFYLSLPNEKPSALGGYFYMRASKMREDQALRIARSAIPEYHPRNDPGIVTVTNSAGESFDHFNTYLAPAWTEYEGELPDELPDLFKKLVFHLLPLEIEREYFFYWLYESLVRRSFVYLVLCGKGGAGKNTLKLVMRALHGHGNTVDGKSSTFKEKFNSQLADNTLAWFDELHYDAGMENAMKEVQNDSISIEKKGVDASRSTRIHTSLVITNNLARHNYIAFDARKFAPLLLRNARLEAAMSGREITALVQKVQDYTKDTFDIAFIAQIGRWVMKHGMSKKFPNSEYKGPMFYRLAHTSMPRWQKTVVQLLLNPEKRKPLKDVVTDKDLGIKWSTLSDSYAKKNKNRTDDIYADYSSVRTFVDLFADSEGRKVFETTPVKGDSFSDFWAKQILEDVSILSEDEILAKDEGNGDKEENDEEQTASESSEDEDGFEEYF